MEQPEEVNIPLAWVGLDETPILFANQFLIQHQPNEFVLTIGQLVPPPILGSSPEERIEQAKQVDFATIRVLARIGMSPTRLRELIAILQGNLEQHDKQMQEIDPTQP